MLLFLLDYSASSYMQCLLFDCECELKSPFMNNSFEHLDMSLSFCVSS